MVAGSTLIATVLYNTRVTIPTSSDEHLAARRGAGLFDASARGRAEVGGPDRTTWLNNLLTNDMKRLAPGQECLAAFLTPQAKVRGLLYVLALQDAYLLDYDATVSATLPAALLKYRISEQVAWRDRGQDLGVLWLQGPAAPAILAAWTNRDPAILVTPRSMTGDPGFCLYIPTAQLISVREQLLTIGAPLGLAPCGMDAWESLRLEAGIPRDGIDITERELLPETGLTQAISATKGCYPGQEFVVRIRDRGQVTRKLVLLALEDATPAPRGAIIHAGDQNVGAVTSSAFVPTQSRALAMGYLQRECCEPGTAVTVMHADGPSQAVVVTGLWRAERAGDAGAGSGSSEGARG